VIIADLHCDLLCYLAEDPGRTPHDHQTLCSLPQLQEGGVKLQTLAFFTQTGKEARSSFEKQIIWFEELLKEQNVLPYHEKWIEQSELSILPAIENASGLCGEDEDLDLAFIRFDEFYERLGLPLYMSFTWHHENRFGGGNTTMAPLKRDGELFLDFLDSRGVAIDLSHTSDPMAEGILNYIHKKGLKILPIASHSNFREVIDHPRNLPDPFVQEIVKMGGVVGINLVADFIGHKLPDDLLAHIEHARKLGVLDSLCFGTDFFYPDHSGLDKDRILFHQELGSSACFPHLLLLLSEVLSHEEKEKVAYKNFLAYLKREEKLELS
jgi:membrane dipeptidase